MPDIKVFIGGRSFKISCGPGEESDATESAKLLDNEAEQIQEQLGRLPEDKMLLLSGLLLADKLRSLKFEKSKVERRLIEKTEKLESFLDSDSVENKEHKVEHIEIEALRRVSAMLDPVVKAIDTVENIDETENSLKSSDSSQQSLI